VADVSQGSGGGKLAFKVYEILCDIVHPSGLGYQILLEMQGLEGGKLRIDALSDVEKMETVDWISAVSIFPASHGCNLLL